jgi:nucleoside-diphosphate-sugar epimerase
VLPACLPDRLSDYLVSERRVGRRNRRGEPRSDRRRQRVVAITGGGGYIGSVLVRRLLDRGHQVRVIERFLYGDGAIRDLLPHPNLSLTLADFRQPHGLDRTFAGVDAVVHLGAIVGDAACALDEHLALSTNVEATNLIANLCRVLGVPRLVFASTWGVYSANDVVLDELAVPNPGSLYARSKLAAERLLLDSPDRRTAPVILRLADVYGVSYRPRFDLAVNALIAGAVTNGRAAPSDDQRSPFIHVDDVARAFLAVIEAPLDRVAGKVFNVGPDGEKHQLQELGAQIRALLPSAVVEIAESSGARPAPRICCEKVRAAVGFQPIRSIADGVAELVVALGGSLQRWQDARFDNCASLEQLIATQPAILVPTESGRLLRVVRGVTPPRRLRAATLP